MPVTKHNNVLPLFKTGLLLKTEGAKIFHDYLLDCLNIKENGIFRFE